MGIRRGSISTPIIADGLIINYDAANRASYPAQRTFTTAESGSCYNTLDLSISGSFIASPTYIAPPTSASCWNFDGIDDYINSGWTIPAISAYTFSTWVKHGAISGNEGIFGDLDAGGTARSGRASIAFRSNGKFHANMGDGTNYWYDLTSYDASSIFDDEWHYIALTVNLYTQKLYIDGSLVHTYDTSTGGAVGSSAIPAGTIGERNYQIGDGSLFGDGVWKGEIANLRVYNRTLSTGDVLHNYNALKGRFA